MTCLEQPSAFYGVGQWSADFRWTCDGEVRGLLADATSRGGTDADP